MSFRVRGLSPAHFAHLIGAPDAVLARHGARRMTVDACPGYPDRVTLRDLPLGESAILLNYEHLGGETPYRSSHAIFIGEHGEAAELVDEVPEVIRRRTISLRAFDADGEMLHAELVDGAALEPVIDRFFADAAVNFLHAHYAVRGCYAARIVRG